MKRKGLVFLSALFVAVLSLMLGISALAAGNDGSDEVSSVSSGTELTPEIVSKNVSYGSNLHIYYAVPVSTVAEGATVSMEFYKSAPTEGAEPFYTVTDYEVQIISAITGSNVNYYVFRSRGFAAKNIGDEIYAVPVSTVGDTAARGEAVKYSIAEYCYERLYKGGFIDKTEEDGDDFSRRELYVSVLEYASAAQQLFYIDKGIDATLVNSLTYYSVSGSNLGVPNGFTDLLTEGKLELSADTAVGDNGTAFASWQMKVYRNGVLQYTDAYTSASHTVTVPEGCSVVISPVIDIVDEHLYRLWEIAEQEKLDEVEVEKQWAALEEKCIEEYGETVGPELVEALKKFYSMYDDAIADWSASIYSKGYMDLDAGQWAGGYYASTGGRDTAGLGPDVQCTEQMLRFISQSGMINHYGGSVTTAIRADLPWMEYQLVYFTLSLQESNGYFYHPQWGIEATDSHLSRRGRDIGWACSILERFYVTPEYETPNGRFPKTESDKNYEKYSAPTSAEEYMAWLISEGLISESEIPETYKNQVSSGASSVALTSYVSSSVSVAVSKVIAAADDGGTAHLDSYEGFLNYLVNKVIPGLQSNPYNMGNEISSISSELSIASEKVENK